MPELSPTKHMVPPSILLVFLAAGGLLLVEKPFQSSRHDEPQTRDSTMAENAQMVDARLWQDPLQPVRSDWRELVQEYSRSAASKDKDSRTYDFPSGQNLPTSIGGFRGEIDDRLRSAEQYGGACKDGHANLLIMPVLVPGGLYSSQVELRRRQRYALVSALASSEFAPENNSGIDYLVAPRTGPFARTKRGAGETPASAHPMLVPYEWFKPRRVTQNKNHCAESRMKWDNVLVLWIDESSLGNRPLTGLESLLTGLTPDRFLLDDGKQIQYRIIGPTSSGTLVVMDREARFTHREPLRRQLESCVFLNSALNFRTIDALKVSLRPFLPKGRNFEADCQSAIEVAQMIGARPVDPESAGGEEYIYVVGSQEPAESWGFELRFEGFEEDELSLMLAWAMDDYLDAGLPENVNQVRLESCLHDIYGNGISQSPLPLEEQKTRVRNCLGPDVLRDDIEDSDVDWADTVTDIFLEYGNWELLNPAMGEQVLETTRGLAPEMRDRIIDLILETTWYLDYGIAPGTDFKALSHCLQEGFAAGEGAQQVCLENFVQTVAESDPAWAASVVEIWEQEHGSALEEAGAGGTPPEEASASSLDSVAATGLNAGLLSPLSKTIMLSARSTMPLLAIESAQHSVHKANQDSITAANPDKRFLTVLRDGGFPLGDFRSTIARDHETAAVLVDELRHRGMFNNSIVDGRKDHLAIVFEMDSDYSRTLPLLVDCYVQQAYLLDDKNRPLSIAEDPCSVVIKSAADQSGSSGSEKALVHPFGYLAGIDGETLKRGTGEAIYAEGAKNQASGESLDALISPPANLELPVGPSQFDYLRRLAERITQVDKDLRAGDDSNGLRAVGVFGSDIYDKQLILQALHRVLPNTVFFTTDLDARLSHPSQYEWNQNLLVATGFGLNLNQGLFEEQKTSVKSAEKKPTTDGSGKLDTLALKKNVGIGIPDMRDGYQTAMFLTTRLALLNNKDDEIEIFGRHFQPPKPRLFEIGRSGEIDISRVRDGHVYNGDACTGKGELLTRRRSEYAPYDICVHGQLGWVKHASQEWFERALKIIVLMGPLLLLMAIWAKRYTMLNPESQRLEARSYLVATTICGIGASVLGAALFFWNSSTLEPFFLFEGISAIPTAALRWVVMTHAICMLFIATGRFSQSYSNLRQEFDLGATIRSKWQTIHIEKWLSEINDRTRGSDYFREDAAVVWADYRHFSRASARLRRTLPYVALMIGITLLWYFFAMRRHALVRDFGSLEDILVGISAVCVISIIFLTTDAMRLCRAYIHALTQYEINWPAKKCRGESIDHGLEGEVYNQLRTIEMITYHTETITPLVILPFTLVFILLVARSNIFDGWEWNPPLVAIYISLSVHLLFRAVRMQREAEDGRAVIIDRLRMYRNVIWSKPDGSHPQGTLRQIDNVISHILAIRRGAFVPWMQHPIVRAIIIPFSGLGTIALLEALA